MGEGMISGIKNITEKIPEIVQNVTDTFQSQTQFYIDIGKNIMTGIGEGITSMSDWLNNLLRSYIDGMVEAVESRLQISSPSELFAGIGGNMAQGLGLGFGDEMNRVTSDIQNAIPREFDVRTSIVGAVYSGLNGVSNESGGINNHFHIAELAVREESDIDKIAAALFRRQQQATRGRGVVFG